MYAVGIAVMSLDGCLTRHDDEGTAFASDADHEFFRAALSAFDCGIMGGAGYRAARESIRSHLAPSHLRVILTRSPDAFAGDAVPGALEFQSERADHVLLQLAERGYRRCALIGGPRTLTPVVQAGLLSELWITLEPVVFGSGLRLFDGEVDARFELTATEHLSAGTLLLRYRATDVAAGVVRGVTSEAAAPQQAS